MSDERFEDGAQVGMNGGPSSPCGGRSESPSRRQDAPAQSAVSRAGGGTPLPGSEATSPLTPCVPGQDAVATVTEIDQSGGGPCGGREEEPKHPRTKRPPRREAFREVKIYLPLESVRQLEGLIAPSGLGATHFKATAFVLGVRLLCNQLGIVATGEAGTGPVGGSSSAGSGGQSSPLDLRPAV